MTIHEIHPEQGTVHGAFSRELVPILTVNSGDTVRYQTLDSGWNIEPRTSTDPSERPRQFPFRDPAHDRGHALCGPIAIRGAHPGMTLAVHILTVRPGSWGWTSAGGWPSTINTRLGIAEAPARMVLWKLDVEAGLARSQEGYVVQLRPFMGVMGMPPDEPGRHTTVPPRIWGGNIDCKELVAGSTLYLPIPVEGALFSVGDGHATQGDGEVSCTAIECPMDDVELRFEVLPDLHLATPRAETPAGWLTMGFDEDLHEASMRALEAMLELLGERWGLPRRDALILASVAVEMRITQLVNGGVLGVHAVLPHGAVRLA